MSHYCRQVRYFPTSLPFLLVCVIFQIFLIMVIMYIETVSLINSMEKIPSWETDSHSASQEIPWLLLDLKVHYRLHKTPLPRFCVTLLNKLVFYGEELWTPSPNPTLENHNKLKYTIPWLRVTYEWREHLATIPGIMAQLASLLLWQKLDLDFSPTYMVNPLVKINSTSSGYIYIICTPQTRNGV